MNRRLRRYGLTALLAIAGTGVAAASASADTVKIGSDLTHAPFDPPAVCSKCTSFQLAQAGGSSPLPLTSPVNGLVTFWAVRTNDPGALYTLKILRPSGINIYLSAGSTQAPSAIPGGTNDGIFAYAASLPIAQGDSVGVHAGGAATGLPQRFATVQDVIANSPGAPADGQTATFTPDQFHELLLQATVEFCRVPDVRRLKRAAARQALAAAGCGPADVTKKKLKPSKKARKKKGRVLKQDPAPGETAAPNAPVGLKVAALKKRRR